MKCRATVDPHVKNLTKKGTAPHVRNLTKGTARMWNLTKGTAPHARSLTKKVQLM